MEMEIPHMPVQRFAAEYNMGHSKRGMAIIFNHENFQSKSLTPRTGTNSDCRKMRDALNQLQFDVVVHKDLRYDEIQDICGKLSEADHSNYDCLIITILSYGEFGHIYAYDKQYKLENIWNYFTECPTLTGKPKLFFIQSCHGDRLRSITANGIETDHSDNQPMIYKIPTYVDFFIACSTIPGSCFMQCLCQELQQNGTTYDISTLLTFVRQRVGVMHQQTLYTITTLTRTLHFHAK